jgi:creatinine amidohydrolase/Fe(II)-dependent formamide hydrolase-like protein
MRLLTMFVCACAISVTGHAQADLEMMTWPELKKAIEGGRTTALVYNGGTETRGPQSVNGGHTLMAHATVLAIADKLGNAIAAPVLPFSPNNANPSLPGTIGLTGPIFAAINEQVAEQLIANGFKSVVLMGDHGGGQKELGEVAQKLGEKYASKGIRVVFCDEVYKAANDQFDKYLTAHNLPLSSHAGIPDTSEMLYLGGDKGWVRKELIATAVGDPQHPNGIRGDARPSTAELGKIAFDMKVNAAVTQIRKLLATAPTQ